MVQILFAIIMENHSAFCVHLKRDSGSVQALAVKEGDIVVFGKYSGQNTIDIDGEELLILNESDVYGVIEA